MLCGGRSAERDVSCVSAAAILRNLRPPCRALLVWIAPDGSWFFQRDPRAFAGHPEPYRFRFERVPARLRLGGKAALEAEGKSRAVGCVFPALHGPFGEDGTVQGHLELAGAPYVGCGVLGSAVGMDKEVTKRLALQAGLPVLPYAVLSGRRMPGRGFLKAHRLKPPVFVKPCRLGSSVGVSKVGAEAGLAAAVRRAYRFDTSVIIEQGVAAREIECAVLGTDAAPRASVAGEIRPNAEFYSYEAKYLDPKGAELLVPAPIPPALARRVRELSILAFKTLGGYGLARVDFLLDRGTGRLWFNEVNTLPGFTRISMYPRLWEASGLSFPRLVERLIRLALLRRGRESRLRVTRD